MMLFGPLDNVGLLEKISRAWLVSALLALAIPVCRELTARWLVSVCRAIARYSYGIYLSHVIVFWVAMDLMQNQSMWLRITTLILLSVGSPIAMYHWLEAPMIRLGVKIAARAISAPANALLGRPAPRQQVYDPAP